MDRNLLEQRLVEAEEHVRLGAEHIAKQRRIIAELARDGHDTAVAKDLLDTFEQVQVAHLADRARVERALKALD